MSSKFSATPVINPIAKALRSAMISSTGVGSVLLCFGTVALADTSSLSLENTDSHEQQQTTKLATVVVQTDKLTDTQKAALRLNDIPGGTNIIDSETLARGRNGSLSDLLANQPGVIVSSVGGNDGAKISIRGSGINNSAGYFREGIKFMFDGLPITGPGGTPYELLNGAGVDHIEVLRGANAFDYGSAALGGAVNMITNTGYTAPGQRIRYETGSYGYQKSVLSTGGVEGNFDYYLNLDNYRSDGYRSDYSLSKSNGSVINLGYRFNPKLETRVIIRYREEYHEDPGTLTLAQLKSDSSKASAAYKAGRIDGRRRGTVWVGSKTTYTFDDDAQLEFGVDYHKYPHANSIQSRGNPSSWDWHDINLSLRYSRVDQLFGRENRASASVTNSQNLLGQSDFPDGRTQELLKRATYKNSADRTINLGNDLNIVDKLWLTTGVSAINVRRDVDISYHKTPNVSAYPDNIDYDNWSLAPRIGLRYELTPQLQVFGNFSRSIDPPASWQYSNGFSEGANIKPLVEQKANTLEFGIKGQIGRFDGSLAVYRSWVRDELLNVQINSTNLNTLPITTAFNASTPTLHQGVELGLKALLWERENGDQVLLRQSYTYSDFHYRNDPNLGSNELPGLPKQVYWAELQYQQPSGFYGGVNLQSVSRTAADYANTLYAPSYTLFGATLGYEAPSKNWKVYLDLKNITDKDYVATVSPIYNAKGKDAAVFYPGDGMGVYTGVEFRF